MCQRTKGLAADGDHLAVGLIDDAVDLLDRPCVGEDLVVGDDVLCSVLAMGVQSRRAARGILRRRPRIRPRTL